jgi:thioredoxin 1
MKEDFNKLINSENPVLIDFYTEWCRPCKLQSQITLEIARDLRSKLRVIKMNIDKNRGVAKKYHIQNMPTLILFKKGKQLWRSSGLTSKGSLIQAIFQYSWT